nr:hypothetical protein CTI12_AA313570 [Ipomoea batatas]
MSNPNAVLLEAYMMRKFLHKQHNTKTVENKATTPNHAAENKNISSSGGCFPLMFKKVHPSSAAPPPCGKDNGV